MFNAEIIDKTEKNPAYNIFTQENMKQNKKIIFENFTFIGCADFWYTSKKTVAVWYVKGLKKR